MINENLLNNTISVDNVNYKVDYISGNSLLICDNGNNYKIIGKRHPDIVKYIKKLFNKMFYSYDKERHEEYYKKNREKIISYSCKWYRDNIDKAKEYKKQWYLKNKARLQLLEKDPERKARRRERVKRCMAKWTEEKKMAHKEYQRKYRIENDKKLKDYFKNYVRKKKEAK